MLCAKLGQLKKWIRMVVLLIGSFAIVIFGGVKKGYRSVRLALTRLFTKDLWHRLCNKFVSYLSRIQSKVKAGWESTKQIYDGMDVLTRRAVATGLAVLIDPAPVRCTRFKVSKNMIN